jgi:hypothetical protein
MQEEKEKHRKGVRKKYIYSYRSVLMKRMKEGKKADFLPGIFETMDPLATAVSHAKR